MFRSFLINEYPTRICHQTGKSGRGLPHSTTLSRTRRSP